MNHTPTRPNTLRAGPDGNGRFGDYGGRYVAETLMPLVLELDEAYEATKRDPSFQKELDYYLKDYVGRPSPLWFAQRLTKALGGGYRSGPIPARPTPADATPALSTAPPTGSEKSAQRVDSR